MDNKFQPSFIPKGPVVDNGSKRSLMSDGITYILAEILFGFMVLACIGVFGYQKLLDAQIQKMSGDLQSATETVQPELIRDLSRASARFQSAKQIVNSHVTISRLFSLLESLTLQTVRFNDFSYSADQTGALYIVMTGEARSYVSVALQSDIFLNDPSFINPQFSNLNLNAKGNVIFSFKSKIDPSVVSYVKGMEQDKAQGIQSNTPPPPTLEQAGSAIEPFAIEEEDSTSTPATITVPPKATTTKANTSTKKP